MSPDLINIRNCRDPLVSMPLLDATRRALSRCAPEPPAIGLLAPQDHAPDVEVVGSMSYDT